MGVLIEIRKSLYVFMFIDEQYPESFAFFILRILELFIRGVCIFLKKQATFEHTLLFLFVNKHVTYLKCAYLKK